MDAVFILRSSGSLLKRECFSIPVFHTGAVTLA